MRLLERWITGERERKRELRWGTTYAEVDAPGGRTAARASDELMADRPTWVRMCNRALGGVNVKVACVRVMVKIW